MPARACVAVAFSGGRDSTALLHAVAHAAHQRGDTDVLALHVHHGLSPQADAWLAHTHSLCTRWADQGWPLRLMHRRVHARAAPGESTEAQARRARYQALREMALAGGAEMVLLAHHRRDQAETLLLQALRGGGVAGLAAMPADTWRDGVRWVRPWLAHPREAIEAYVAQHALSFVEDASNLDTRFARNRLRHAVWPALVAAFPQAEAALADAAAQLADALGTLQHANQHALERAGWQPEQAAQLPVSAWVSWPEGERRALLHHWYRQASGQGLGRSWLLRLACEVPALHAKGQAAHWAAVGLGLYRGALRFHAPPAVAPMPAPASVPLCITTAGVHPVPGWPGHLHVQAVTHGGVAAADLAQAQARGRSGGESFQIGPGRPARSLKKQYQALGVPAWERHGPLLYAGERLLWAPGLGVDARTAALPGEPQWALTWVTTPAT